MFVWNGRPNHWADLGETWLTGATRSGKRQWLKIVLPILLIFWELSSQVRIPRFPDFPERNMLYCLYIEILDSGIKKFELEIDYSYEQMSYCM